MIRYLNSSLLLLILIRLTWVIELVEIEKLGFSSIRNFSYEAYIENVPFVIKQNLDWNLKDLLKRDERMSFADKLKHLLR